MTVQLIYPRDLRIALYAEFFEETGAKPRGYSTRTVRDLEERILRFNIWMEAKYGGKICFPPRTDSIPASRLSDIIVEFPDDETAMMFKLRTADLI